MKIRKKQRVWDIRVFCKVCSQLLDYEKGSLAWQYKSEDLCTKCLADKCADETIKRLKEAL
jgi:hypothetical protein